MKSPRFFRMFGYDTKLLPNKYLAKLETGVTSIEDAREKTGATIGQPRWGLLYYLLLSHLDRNREEIIVETGTNLGMTTIILAQALIDSGCRGKVMTFELETENLTRAVLNFKKAGVENSIEQFQGDSLATLPKALKDIDKIRFCFLDASHLYSDVKAEFETVFPKLSDDALVVFDNTFAIADEGEDQRVNGFLKDLPQLYGGNLINMEFVSWWTTGLAIWQKTPYL